MHNLQSVDRTNAIQRSRHCHLSFLAHHEGGQRSAGGVVNGCVTAVTRWSRAEVMDTLKITTIYGNIIQCGADTWARCGFEQDQGGATRAMFITVRES
jgi:hypothetical protein